jgi:hypothetical protein
MKEVTTYLALKKQKLPSIALDALAKHYGLPRKSEDMSYKQLSLISTSY